jgi:Fe-Mn family superoxide dismutase
LRYPFTLPELPYGTEAFAPGIDIQTMEIHHGKHHAGYVRKLNAALEAEPNWQSKTLGELLADIDALPESIRTAVRNNGGGHANHALYWSTMRPGGSQPTGQLAADIERDFGGLDGLRAELKAAASGQFGSGWAWLVADSSGALIVRSTANQDSPMMDGQRPLFGIDVWEHAYYLNYQNRRGDYVDAFLDIADWAAVSDAYATI